MQAGIFGGARQRTSALRPVDDLGCRKFGIAPIYPPLKTLAISCGDDGVDGQWIPWDRRGLADVRVNTGEDRADTAPTASEE